MSETNGGTSESSEPKESAIDREIDKLEKKREEQEDDRLSGNLKSQKARGWTEKMITRTTSGAIYAIVTVGCLFWGVIPTAVLVSAMAWLCCSEFYRMSRMGGRMPNEIVGLTAAILFPLAPVISPHYGLLVVILLLLIACAVWFVFNLRVTIGDVAITAFGPIYTSLMFACIVLIRKSDPGFWGGLLAFGVMGSVWLNDTTAYFVGSRFGRHKLAPKISPNKSIEGFWGGIVGTVVVWLILARLGVAGIGYGTAVACGIVVGITSVVGDLFESRIKRGVGVKDSGNIMPGHGGLLDRSDSMLFASMTAYLLLHVGGIL